jgi:hypothetical protein
MKNLDKTKYLALLLLLLLANFYPMLSGRAVPAGDGRRILPTVAFINKAESFPLWDPYREGGQPFMANPEKFIILGHLLNSNDPHVYFKLNLVYLTALFCFAAAVYFVALQLKVSPAGSMLAGFIAATSQMFVFSLYSGNPIQFLAASAGLGALVFYCKFAHSRKLWLLLTSGLLIGFEIYVLGYYVVLTALLCWLYGLWWYRRKTELLSSAARSTLEVGAMLICGFCAFAVILFPMVELLATHLATHSPIGSNGLYETLPWGISFPAIFIPVINLVRNFPSMDLATDNIFYFTSMPALPLIVIAVLNRRKLPPEFIYPIIVLAIMGIVLAGRVFPLNSIISRFGSIPFICHVRWSSTFHFYFSIALSLLCGFGFQAFHERPAEERISRFVPALSVVLLFGCGFLLHLLSPGHKTAHTIWSEQSLIWPAGLGILYLLPYPSFTRKHFCVYIAVLVAAQIIFLRFHGIPETTRSDFKEVAATAAILKDKMTGPGCLDKVFNFRQLPVPIRSYGNYSVYFSPEHRFALETVIGKPITALRFSWVPAEYYLPASSWNEAAMEAMNLRYLFLRTPNIQEEREYFDTQYTRLCEDGPFTLLERKNWVCPLRVLSNWEIVPDLELVKKRMNSKDFNPLDTVLLAKDPGLPPVSDNSNRPDSKVELTKFSENELSIDVVGDHPGVLYIPEYYEKNWKARVNGKPVEVIRANGAFRAVPVLAGRQRVELFYSQVSMKIGLGVSAAYLLTWFLVGFFLRWGSREVVAP